MLSLDTNIIIRLLVEDDELQFQKVTELLDSLQQKNQSIYTFAGNFGGKLGVTAPLWH